MAGDWIKIELTTPDKPEVIRMATALRLDQDTVVGKLIRVWAWADQNSVNGNDVRVTGAFLDRLTTKRGFAAAMRAVGWLSGDDGRLSLPNFDLHNGETAKERAQTNRRVAQHRKRRLCNAASVTDVTPPALIKPLPEKRREEIRERERTGAPDPSAGDVELKRQALEIGLAWDPDGVDMDVLGIIMDHLRGGIKAPEMLAATVQKAGIVAQWEHGRNNQFVPRAIYFFRGKQWQEPETAWAARNRPKAAAAPRAPRKTVLSKDNVPNPSNGKHAW